MRQTIYILILLFALQSGNVQAIIDVRSQRFTTSNGLTNNSVRHIMQDSKGFLWLSTLNGISRYDGNAFVNFTPGSTDNRLTDHRIILMKEDYNGFIWMQSILNLVCCYNPVTDSFVDYSGCNRTMGQYDKIYFDKRTGQVWLRGKGNASMCVTYRDGRFTSGLISDPDSLAAALRPNAVDRQKEEDLQSLFEGRTGKFVRDNKGNPWLYDEQGHISYICPVTRQVKDLQLMSPSMPKLMVMSRYNISVDHSGIIWITTYGNGLFALEPQTGELTHFLADDPNSVIGSNFLLDVFVDRTGNIWVSSEHAGISRLKVANKGSRIVLPKTSATRQQRHLSKVIRMMHRTEDGRYWVATRDGSLYRYDTTDGSLKPERQYETNVYAISTGPDGSLWLGFRGEGLLVNGHSYRHRPDDPGSLPSDHIYSLLKDSRGRMWVGTFGGGLALAEPTPTGYRFRTFMRDFPGQMEVRILTEDANHHIWMGTSDGVYIFNPDELLDDEKKYFSYTKASGNLRSNEVRSIVCDSRGRVWISELGSGVAMCDLGKPGADCDYASLSFTHYTTATGLANSMVQCFVEDKQREAIWISTELGLSCLDLKQQKFRNYQFSFQTLGNVYTENCGFILPDGSLAFGTNMGLRIVDPQQVRQQYTAANVCFTELKLNGLNVRPADEDSPLRQSLVYTGDLDMRHYQNSFRIDFTTFEFAGTGEVKYVYRLPPYDKGWSQPSPLNFAAYKNLPPGRYTLQVKATNESGEWTPTSTLGITINPPFWKTTWAYLLYICLLAVCFYIGWRIFRRFLRLRQQVRMEEQMTEYKLVFFTNVSHEFRTPLTLIQGGLEQIHRLRAIPRELAGPIKVMDKNTRRMMRLIDQLLEFRKMQHDKLKLSLEETEVVAFVQDIFSNFKEAAASKKMTYTFSPRLDALNIYIDKGKIDKVIYNLLSNAMKYTPTGGSISVTLGQDADTRQVAVTVTDTGVGIPVEKRSELFKRFANSSFTGNSMGVGLHLSSELTKVHHGTLTFHENPEGGSVFTLTLPTDKSVYQEADFLIAGNALLRDEEVHASSVTPAKDDRREDLPPIPLNKRKVLVVEDDNEVRDFVTSELAPYFEVASAADGTEGLSYAQEHEVDLIISDVMMPVMTGTELTHRLKSDFKTSHIPVILLTALNTDEQHVKGFESGADAYITKPFSVRLLLTRIFKLIEQRDKLKEKFGNDPTLMRPVICTNDRDKEFADRLAILIKASISDPQLMIDDIADRMNMGRSIFYRKVKGVTGYTPNEYIRILRLKKAAELLEQGELNVSEVAFQVGISDPFYFSKCFKKQFGISPAAYQKGERNVEKTETTAE